MGWRRTLITINATINKLEKENKRRQKLQAKEELKMQALLTVQSFEDSIYNLTCMHQNNWHAPINWEEIKALPEPLKPKTLSISSKEIQGMLDTKSSSYMTRILTLDYFYKRYLRKKLIKIQQIETTQQVNFKKELKKWKKQHELAIQILAKDFSVYLDALNEINDFSNISKIGKNINFIMHDNGILEATIQAHDISIIPTQAHSLTSAKNLSTKNLSQNKINTFYQAYIYSAMLKVAKEISLLLPIENLLISVQALQLNKQTGHLIDQTIASAFMPISTLNTLNFSKIEAVPAMNNFIFNSHFSKNYGFSPVEKISIDEIKF